MPAKKPIIGTVLFPGFELLDVFGPLELFLIIPGLFDSVILGHSTEPVASGQGPATVVEQSFSDTDSVDILLIPGGKGTRVEVENTRLISEINRLAERATLVCSVCTGAALLAKTGLLNQKRATTNKAAWKWATSQGREVNWIPEARWVEDSEFFTSSGVSAGMDMALAVIRKIHGEEHCQRVALTAEYQWNHDSSRDPFARIHGLA